MAINLSQNPVLATITGLKTIDASKINPTIGTNIKLINTSDSSLFFVGVVTRLVPEILNYSRGIYSAMILEGTDSTGSRRTITIDIAQLEEDSYSGFNRMFYTNTLSESTPEIFIEENDDLVLDDAEIQVFDTANVKIGSVITYKLADGTQVEGVISTIDLNGVNIRVNTLVNGKLGTVILTLVDATNKNCEAAVICAEYL